MYVYMKVCNLSGLVKQCRVATRLEGSNLLHIRCLLYYIIDSWHIMAYLGDIIKGLSILLALPWVMEGLS